MRDGWMEKARGRRSEAIEFGIGNAECGKLKQMSEVGGQRTEVGGRRAEAFECGMRNAECRMVKQRAEIGGRGKTEVGDQRGFMKTDGRWKTASLGRGKKGRKTEKIR